MSSDLKLEPATARRQPGLRAVIANCLASSAALAACRHMDIYVFGVFQGLSIQGTIKTLLAHNVTFNTLWGFDSFAGLPTESGALDNYKTNIPWTAGAFSTASLFGAATTAAQAEEKLLERLITTTGYKRIKFVRGFYNESLTPILAQRMRPALYIDMDCDLHSSTMQALEWVLTQRLLSRHASTPTICFYDDWAAGGTKGQTLAHRQALAGHNAAAWEVPHTRAGAAAGSRTFAFNVTGPP